jgi:hypothetical protein
MTKNEEKHLAGDNPVMIVISLGLTSLLQSRVVFIYCGTSACLSMENSFPEGGILVLFIWMCSAILLLCRMVETVIWSFKKCGILNLIDDTEDDLLWHDAGQSKPKPRHLIQSAIHIVIHV